MSTPMTLSTDDSAALSEIATYICTARVDKARAVREAESPGEVIGFWQTSEWFEGLLELADIVQERYGMEGDVLSASELLQLCQLQNRRIAESQSAGQPVRLAPTEGGGL
jgi:hypothetical protein